MKIVTMFGVLASIILTVLILFSQFGCRFEEDPLDKNREPETFLTYAPPETLNANYRVHIYWHGEDKDGTVVKYIFYLSDSIRTLTPEENRNAEVLDWNPAKRKADYITGQFTTRTDSVFLFKGYDIDKKVTRNKQAFHIVAVDDGGLIDKTPARIQFYATVAEVPTIKYWVKIADRPYDEYKSSNLETISLKTPLRFKFQGTTDVVADAITGYLWAVKGVTYPLGAKWYIPTPGEIIEFPSEINEYYFTNRETQEPDSAVFLNTEADPLSDGDFYFRGVARDQAGALSEANPVTGNGLCRIVVNFDPDTKVLYGDNYYYNEAGLAGSTKIIFSDDSPDTLPLGSVVRINYEGWDDRRDNLEFDPPVPIRFKYRLEYTTYSSIGDEPSIGATSFLPMSAKAEDSNPGDKDSVSMSVGSCEYTFSVRSYDEQYRYDHTPAQITFYGNFQPTVDSFELGVMKYGSSGLVFFSLGDTVKLANPKENWGFYPYLVLVNENEIRPCVKIEDGDTTGLFYPVTLKFTGHDDSRDPVGSAIKAWYYWIDGDYSFRNENEILYAEEDDLLLKDIRINIPFDEGAVDTTRLGQLPSGVFPIHILGFDMGVGEEFTQVIRMTPAGDMYTSVYNTSNYARKDTLNGQFYIKQKW
jgi:hypothetical protein